MKILAFDPAKTTGFAFFDTSRDHSAIQCGVLEMPDKADPYYTGDQLGLKVTRLIKDFGKPDFAILEEQSLAQIGNSNAAAIIYAWGSSLAIVATLSNHGVPYGTITPGSWRKMFFGASFKPPQKPAKPGKKPENDWKAAAVSECERLGIVIPSRKTIAHNACEAAALAICWRGAKLHAKRYEGAFMNLLQQRNTRPSADLFGATA